MTSELDAIDGSNIPSSPTNTTLARSDTNRNTLESVTALARFEFEPGRGNDGTKVLMVEWQDDNETRHKTGSWQISWPGKKTTFAADDNPSDSTNRLYHLLPPGDMIPPSITITYRPPNERNDAKGQKFTTRDAQNDDGVLHMVVHPLPAIFTPELGATAKASGKKGVLHTVWAKKRLQVLAREIRAESEHNLEGIALNLAIEEKHWIEQNFGVVSPPSSNKPQSAQGLKLDIGSANSGYIGAPLSPGSQTPQSPGGSRRLTDKLKGLSLMTSNKDLSHSVNTPTRDSNPLSPEVGDMAVSSFSTFKGDRPAKPQSATSRKIVPISPPSAVSDEQAQSASASLAEIARGGTGLSKGNSGFTPISSTSQPQQQNGDHESDDLFAVAMSPRDPDDPKSPFSIPSGESGGSGAFSKIKGIKG